MILCVYDLNARRVQAGQRLGERGRKERKKKKRRKKAPQWVLHEKIIEEALPFVNLFGCGLNESRKRMAAACRLHIGEIQHKAVPGAFARLSAAEV